MNKRKRTVLEEDDDISLFDLYKIQLPEDQNAAKFRKTAEQYYKKMDEQLFDAVAVEPFRCVEKLIRQGANPLFSYSQRGKLKHTVWHIFVLRLDSSPLTHDELWQTAQLLLETTDDMSIFTLPKSSCGSLLDLLTGSATTCAFQIVEKLLSQRKTPLTSAKVFALMAAACGNFKMVDFLCRWMATVKKIAKDVHEDMTPERFKLLDLKFDFTILNSPIAPELSERYQLDVSEYQDGSLLQMSFERACQFNCLLDLVRKRVEEQHCTISLDAWALALRNGAWKIISYLASIPNAKDSLQNYRLQSTWDGEPYPDRTLRCSYADLEQTMTFVVQEDLHMPDFGWLDCYFPERGSKESYDRISNIHQRPALVPLRWI